MSEGKLEEIMAKVEAAAELQRSQYFHEIYRGNIDMANALVELARYLAKSASPKQGE